MSHKPTYEELEKKVQELERVELEGMQTEEELSQIFSMSLDPICIADINTATFIKVNPAFTEILGYSEEELLGKPFLEFIHPSDINATRTVVEQKLQMGSKVINFENRYQANDGTYRWLSWVAHPNKEKGVTYSVARDITELKHNEEALKKSKALLETTGRMAKVGGWELDADTMEVAWTEETYRIHETPLDHKPPLREAINYFHPDDRPQLELAINHALDHGEPYDMEIRFISAQGNPLWVRTKCQPEIINGKVVRLHGTFQDITDRKRVEEALKESKTFLENMTDAAYIADDQGNVLWVNPAAEQVTGLPPEEIIGKPFLPLFVEADHASLIDVYKKTLAGESLENTLTFKSDATCHFTSLPKRNSQGDIIGTFGIARDISERLAAEKALRTSEARLKKAQAMAKVGNWEYDIATGKVWGSEEAFRIYGIERTSEFLPLDEVESYIIDAKMVNQALEDLITQNKAYDIEFQIHPKNRKESIHVHSMAELVYDGDGKPEKVVGVIQDITESKQAEEILHKSHEMLKLTEAMANIGSWEWDVQHDRAHWSEELFRIFGRDPAEGAPTFAEQSKFYFNKDMQRLKDAVEICVKRGTPYEIELRAVRTDGEIRHCVSRGQAQYDEKGKVYRLAGSFQDITERKLIELSLKESEDRFKALHNASFGGIAIHDKGLILECNKGLTEITGYGYDELIGMDGLSLISDDTRDKVIQNIEACYEKPYEVMGIRKSGELYPLRLEARNIPYKEKNVRVVEFRDISENKRAEKEKEELEGKLRQAQKMEAVGRLAGGVAHDFNNMLSVIIGHASLALEDVDPSQPIYERLEEIRKAGERSANLTRQLLAFARKQTVSPKVLDLNQTVGSMSNMLERLVGEDIDLLWLPDENLWPVKVDPSQIDQILANLCVNARDAIADVGKVTIETGNVVFDEAYCIEHPGFNPGEYVLMAVSDNGCGMKAEILENIFEPFFTTKGPEKGTGLGLATVYGVVKQNDGFVNVYSEPGQGTTFKTFFPRYKAKADLLSKDEKNIPTELGHETILLVEDEIAILRLTTQMLEKLGYKVVAARTPGEAIHLAQEHTGEIHLLVTDVVMPEMNGRDLAKNILSIYPNLKRLFMSGYTANVDSPPRCFG
jgi:PAS domain S-box-containing protein